MEMYCPTATGAASGGQIPGATGTMAKGTGELASVPAWTASVASPGGISNGTCALIWAALTNSSGAAMPLMDTDVPPRSLGRGREGAVASAAARFTPKMEISDPGAMDG